jgi:hypothetical protein
MSIATLASDRDVSASTRLRSWASRFVLRSVATVGEQPARWPFTSAETPKRQRRQTATASQPVQRPVRAQDKAPVTVSPPVAVERPKESLDTHSQSLGTASQALDQGLTMRQKVVDVVMVLMWGALIPGLMWIGAMAGF